MMENLISKAICIPHETMKLPLKEGNVRRIGLVVSERFFEKLTKFTGLEKQCR